MVVIDDNVTRETRLIKPQATASNDSGTRLDGLVTHTFPLDQVNEAIAPLFLKADH